MFGVLRRGFFECKGSELIQLKQKLGNGLLEKRSTEKAKVQVHIFGFTYLNVPMPGADITDLFGDMLIDH